MDATHKAPATSHSEGEGAPREAPMGGLVTLTLTNSASELVASEMVNRRDAANRSVAWLA